MKRYLYIFVVTLKINTYSQEAFFSFINDQKLTESSIGNMYNTVNLENDFISVSIEDSEKFYNYLFNEKFERIDTLTTENLPSKYKIYHGNTVFNSKYNLYFSNNNCSKFGVLNLNYDDNIFEISEIDINLNDDFYIGSLKILNNFYVLSITNDSSILNIYKFEEDTFVKKSIDFTGQKFLNKKNNFTSLYSVFYKSKSISIILDDEYSYLEKAFSEIKIFPKKSEITISIDDALTVTQLIRINLDDFTNSVKTINQPFIKTVGRFKRSNSFFLQNKLFQIISSSKNAKIKVTDLNSELVLKEFDFSAKKNISFSENKNPTKKELRKAKSFINKLSINDMGIFVKFEKDKFKINFGSYIVNGGTGMAMTPGFGSFSMNSGNVSFTPGAPIMTFYSFGSSNIMETTEIGTFNKNFDLINDVSFTNPYAEIRNFIFEKEDIINSKATFWYKGNLILATNIKKSNGINLYKF